MSGNVSGNNQTPNMDCGINPKVYPSFFTSTSSKSLSSPGFVPNFCPNASVPSTIDNPRPPHDRPDDPTDDPGNGTAPATAARLEWMGQTQARSRWSTSVLDLPGSEVLKGSMFLWNRSRAIQLTQRMMKESPLDFTNRVFESFEFATNVTPQVRGLGNSPRSGLVPPIEECFALEPFHRVPNHQPLSTNRAPSEAVTSCNPRAEVTNCCFSFMADRPLKKIQPHRSFCELFTQHFLLRIRGGHLSCRPDP